jgi:AAA15 family ATPase/GTPase
MLSSITIKNFKAIQDEIEDDGSVKEKPMTLRGLGRVNYLVGPNGCGKSSVLELISNLTHFWTPIEEGVWSVFKLTDKIATNNTIFSINTDLDESLIIRNENEPCITFKERLRERGEYKDVKDGKVILHGPVAKISPRLFQFNQSYDSFRIEILISDLERFFIGLNDSYLKKLLAEIKTIDKKVDPIRISSGVKWLNQLLPILSFQHTQTTGMDGSYPIILIEEPEIGLHPAFQKLVPKLLSFANSSSKFIISTHSPFIINSALSLEGENQKVYQISEGQCSNPEGISSLEVKSFYNILGDLGASPSDLLFANCIIWIEGPSDRIYIKYWLELEGVKEHTDYEFAMYGGSNLSHYTGEFWSNKTKQNDIDSFINILKTSPKCILYMDSDFKDKSEKLTPQKTKSRVKKELEDSGNLVWVSDFREIENYIPKEVFTKYINSTKRKNKQKFIKQYDNYANIWKFGNGKNPSKIDKIVLAEYVVKEKVGMHHFDLQLQIRIKKYAKFIKSCN